MIDQDGGQNPLLLTREGGTNSALARKGDSSRVARSWNGDPSRRSGGVGKVGMSRFRLATLFFSTRAVGSGAPRWALSRAVPGLPAITPTLRTL